LLKLIQYGVCSLWDEQKPSSQISFAISKMHQHKTRITEPLHVSLHKSTRQISTTIHKQVWLTKSSHGNTGMETSCTHLT
jgi:hypothetical protein